MLHIITNPRVYLALQKEIDAANLSMPSITYAEACDLPYLQAVIKEGLRIWPPLASLESKVVPECGDTFKGVYLPGGTHVGLCIWGVMRRSDIWGKDAEIFRPERWLDTSEDKLKIMESTLDLIFHPGRWGCLGQDMARRQLNKVLPEVS